ncbi:MAG TPA: hypothetical protein VFK61_04650 [Candidatus Limnocylindria bacterium]|nr:hypothetical protein [Candidatus Limnocylindria bacterium]
MAAALMLGAILAARPASADAADPSRAAERHAVASATAQRAQDRLELLVAEIEAAIDAGRQGSALIIEGDEDPAPSLQQAADAAARGESLAADARAALQELGGMLRSVAPDRSLPGGVSRLALSGVDTQLADAAAAAGSFVERRHAAAETLDALARALDSLDDDDPAAALDELATAREARRVVAAWPEAPPVLPLWLRTTRAMLGAARDIATAALDHDAAAAAEAGRRYRRAADGARQADTALALAISETGGSLASTPLARLADALAKAHEAQAAVASVLQMDR